MGTLGRLGFPSILQKLPEDQIKYTKFFAFHVFRFRTHIGRYAKCHTRKLHPHKQTKTDEAFKDVLDYLYSYHSHVSSPIRKLTINHLKCSEKFLPKNHIMRIKYTVNALYSICA